MLDNERCAADVPSVGFSFGGGGGRLVLGGIGGDGFQAARKAKEGKVLMIVWKSIVLYVR
jgi:hypothetical protein